jgi:hypothetical protein
VPLRSVEAATRDDAIAAAREQFGPSARVVGVRRVRSGGVLGFFATERYVAEVANDPAGRPAVPVPASGRPGAGERSAEPSTGYTSSPLSAAAPATAAPSSAGGRARAAAPARNGAAAWAAAASASEPAGSPAAAPASSSRADEERVSELAGLLGLESAPAAPLPGASLYGRTSFPRVSSTRPAAFPVAAVDDDEDDDSPFVEDYIASRPVLSIEDTPAAPSPFTAALARMVSGDRDVREAVEHALEKPVVMRSRSDAEPWPSRSGSLRSEDTSVPSPAARQEEETVGDQVIAPPSTDAPLTAELPNWAVEPEVAGGGSPREEAIAEVLRSALAQGHSDEALAGILRKVLAGASPQTAFSEPATVPEPVGSAVPEVPAPEPAPLAEVAPTRPEFPAPATMSLAMALAAAGITASEPAPAVEEIPAAVVASPTFEATEAAPAAEEPEAALDAVDEAPLYEAPAFEDPAYEEPVYEAPAFELAPVPAASAATSYLPSTSIWGTATDSIWGGSSIDSIWGGGTASEIPLWADPGTKRTSSVSASDSPIWDAVARHELPPADGTGESAVLEAQQSAAEDLPVFETMAMPVVETATDDVPSLDAAAEVEELSGAQVDSEVAPDTEATQNTGVAEAIETDVRESCAAEDEVAVLAPVLARTASDPAPMSLDATTVMPPLSLLPPLPGSRGRGRPPVPPSTSRPRTPAAHPQAPSVSTPPAEPEAPAAPVAPATTAKPAARPATSPLATVTRLPVAPLMATPETPEMPDLFAEVRGDEPVMPDPVAVEPVAVEPAVAEPVAAAPLVAEPVVAALVVADPAAAEPAPRQEAQQTADREITGPRTTRTETARPRTAPPTALPSAPGSVASQLETLGVPGHLLGSGFAADVQTHGIYAALTRALGLRLPQAPELPTGAGEVLFVVGPGVETLRAARSLAASLRLDPDRVQWATRGDLAGLAPKGSRVTTVDTALDRCQDVTHAGTVTIVAVDAPMRTDAYWMAQMLAIWSPVAVWAVVEATRKPEDLEPWIDGLPRVDALMVQDTDLSADPAAVLRRVATPVALLDGIRATPHRWASLLCERLEGVKA